jgi:hypothetical protein
MNIEISEQDVFWIEQTWGAQNPPIAMWPALIAAGFWPCWSWRSMRCDWPPSPALLDEWDKP